MYGMNTLTLEVIKIRPEDVIMSTAKKALT